MIYLASDTEEAHNLKAGGKIKVWFSQDIKNPLNLQRNSSKFGNSHGGNFI